jgi:hypothetical protein
MDSLNKLIVSSIRSYTSKIINKISKKYDIDVEELKELFNEVNQDDVEDDDVVEDDEDEDDDEEEDGRCLYVLKKGARKDEKCSKVCNGKLCSSHEKLQAKPKAKSKTKESKKTSEEGTCIYKYVRGAKKDETCSKKCKDNYCALHIKSKEVKEVKAKPAKGLKSTPKSSPKSPILRLIEDSDHVYHPESKLVFQSASNRIVVGIMDDDDNVVLGINDDIIELAKSYKFKYIIEDIEEAIKEIST